MNNPVDYWYKKYLQEREKNKKTIKILQIKQEWSEEDYNRISSIKYLLHELDNHNFDDWFDSLKERLGCKN